MTKRIAIELFLAAAIGALLGLLGPFETYRMNAGPRMVYWIFVIVAGHLILRPTLLAGRWLAEESRMPGWLALILAIAVGSLPVTLLVAWILSGFDLAKALRFDELPVLYGQVLLISGLVNMIFSKVLQDREAYGLAVFPAPPVEATAPVLPESSPGFATRLPAGFGPLRALGGEDHYVRAYGDNSNALILIRLRDAIAELGSNYAGMQVHRSWWVARDAVTGHSSEGRAIRFKLVNGIEVPVARERIAALKDAGWL